MCPRQERDTLILPRIGAQKVRVSRQARFSEIPDVLNPNVLKIVQPTQISPRPQEAAE
jgi:hypothetical protein